jgi:hypothetical protein
VTEQQDGSNLTPDEPTGTATGLPHGGGEHHWGRDPAEIDEAVAAPIPPEGGGSGVEARRVVG